MTVDLLHLIEPRRSAAAEALLIDLLTPAKVRLTDDDVRLIRELNAYHGIGYKKLAKKFEASVACIQGICKGRRRRGMQASKNP